MAETAITELIPRERPERESLGMRVSILVERAGSADCETVTGQLNVVPPDEMTVLVSATLGLVQGSQSTDQDPSNSNSICSSQRASVPRGPSTQCVAS